jgi:hypothetical protein
MYFVIAFLYLLLCAALICQMVASRKLEWCQLGIIGTFSIGYYVLPVIFRPLSSLAQVPDDDIGTVLLVHGLFLMAVVLGVVGAPHILPRGIGLSMRVLDGRFTKHRRVMFTVCFVMYLLFFTIYGETSYASEDFNTYFTDKKSTVVAMLSEFSSLWLATVALGFALELRKGRKTVAVAMMGAILVVVGLSLSLAQRLAIITPLAMVLTALFLTGQTKRAVRSLGLLVIILLLVSPFAVFMRQTQLNVRGKGRILSVGQGFSYGEDVVISSLRSIIDRADLLGNSIKLKQYIDHHGYVDWQFYYSVFVSPVPRVILQNKPYVLSSDGTMWGEISVIAWANDFGGIGSLTAFGGITAYRQGGWIAVFLDGLTSGVCFVFLARWLGRGGFTANVFYITLFPLLTIKRVPPSLFETLSELLPMLPIVLALVLLNLLLTGRRESLSRSMLHPRRHASSLIRGVSLGSEGA